MEKQIKIALAGNPNCGKTTLFNALTGSNQFVGNWPGVTVEKKEGKLKKHDNVVIMDLPGIYSLSPYTLEEVVARNYLVGERPDAILNIIDGTNLERNLYLTTQLTELGIPVVIAINMMDVVRKNGDQINVAELSRELGVRIIEISALKGDGVMEAAEAAVKAAEGTKTVPMHTFSGPVEHAIAHIEEATVHGMPEEQQRWYAIKIFERDDKVLEQLQIPADGSGDHPAFMMVSEAKKALETIGMNLIITDLSDSSGLWTGIDAHQVDMWCAAWSATVDPDMYQIYYSDVANCKGDLSTGKNPYGGAAQGGSNKMYCIADPELDNLIMTARESLDQSYRKTMYKACLDIVVDWAVEVPVYQRQNAIIFSTERVNMSTVTPDITTFYKWYSEIEKIELN